ncbi:hypothetical protein KQX54_001707 [Cotesia glomerata]|uniref:Uncharacterized protein n=1 Tax=Cotesia glomerata TaxID=32391 RepID=A0AAV7I4G7_COTGL|nr:hypothetical protein KQX54_001707 [Cotesia glomerata]
MEFRIHMDAFEIDLLCLAVIVVAEAGLISKAHHNFPYLNSVYHGHGATSYQNVDIQNHLSVPIPKDLQVDDGHEHAYDHKIELIHAPEHSEPSYGSSDAYEEDLQVAYRYHPDNYEHYDNLDYEYH